MSEPKKIMSLEDFEGFDDFKFFEEEPSEAKVEKKEEKVAEEKPEEKDEKPKKEFSFEEEEEDKKPESTTESFYKNMLKSMKDIGAADFEEEFEFDSISEEDAEDLFKDKFEEQVDLRLRDLFEELPDQVKEINKLALNNGDVVGYLKLILDEEQLPVDFDIENEEHQVLKVKKSLKSKGYSDNYIETQVDFLKEHGKLKDVATEEYNKEEKERAFLKKKMLKEAEEAKEREKLEHLKLKRRISETVSKLNEVNGIPINKDVKKVLPQYLSEKAYKLNNGTNITEFQKDLFEALNNEDVALQFAILLKNRDKNGNLDFSFIKADVESKVTKGIKNDIRRQKDTLESARGSSQQKSLADFFDK